MCYRCEMGNKAVARVNLSAVEEIGAWSPEVTPTRHRSARLHKKLLRRWSAEMAQPITIALPAKTLRRLT